MAGSRDSNSSSLFLKEYFSTGDDRFLDALYDFHSPKALARIADKWKTDPRPWARRQVLSYLERPLDTPGHEPIVKRLFKHFETQADDEIMAAFMVAFDRLVRRRRKTQWHYDWRTRESWQEERLVSPRDRVESERAGNAHSRPTDAGTGRCLDESKQREPIRARTPFLLSYTLLPAPARMAGTSGAWASSGPWITCRPSRRACFATVMKIWPRARTSSTAGRCCKPASVITRRSSSTRAS